MMFAQGPQSSLDVPELLIADIARQMASSSSSRSRAYITLRGGCMYVVYMSFRNVCLFFMLHLKSDLLTALMLGMKNRYEMETIT